MTDEEKEIIAWIKSYREKTRWDGKLELYTAVDIKGSKEFKKQLKKEKCKMFFAID